MDDPILPLKRQFWNAWFHEPIPMLDNQSPLQAATTTRGRAKLEELLAFSGQMRSQSSDAAGNLDVNVPAAYARWKLGYGPGSPQEFAVEEAILNYTDPRQPTQRQPSHAKKLEKKKHSIFVPRRCEVVGCNKTGKEDTKGCGRCGLAFYCGKEHQTQDWSRHKIDCKAIRKMHLSITPKPFTPARELDKFPLGCFPIVEQEQSDFPVDATRCFICHSKPPEVELTRTKCCNLPVCDNSHEYKIMSYSRDFCQRSHEMYTKCATHFNEDHEGDWRECETCNQMEHGARPFAATNAFCATPCLESFLPQGSMLTYPCDGCPNRLLPGHISAHYSTRGEMLCQDCA